MILTLPRQILACGCTTVVASTQVAPTVATGALADIESGTTVRDVDVQPAGFTTAMIEVTKVDGTVCELCMWLADTGDERGQGLKGVTSLGTPEGMAFVWNEPTTGSFFMFQTVTPLSIAWFDAPVARAGGALVSTADMEPCVSRTQLTANASPQKVTTCWRLRSFKAISRRSASPLGRPLGCSQEPNPPTVPLG